MQQSNGLYAVWSSVVDDFVLLDATRDEIIEDFCEAERERITRQVNCIVTELSKGGRPYFQFTKTFDECIAIIRELHGDDAESLKLLLQGGGK